MKSLILCLVLVVLGQQIFSQHDLSPLTVEKIMRDPKWIGSSPSNIYWSNDGKYLFFNWNAEKAVSDSLYYISKENGKPTKADFLIKQTILSAKITTYNHSQTAFTYSREGDIYFGDARTGKTKRVTQTVDYESNPFFAINETKIIYLRSQNLFSWDISSGQTVQLTNFQKGPSPLPDSVPQNLRRRQVRGTEEKKDALTAQEKWLGYDQLQLFDVLRERKQKKDLTDSVRKAIQKEKELRPIYTDDKILFNILLSPDGKFVTYGLYKTSLDAKNTIVPNYITENGFTQDIPGREKVGVPQGSYEFFVFDTENDSIIKINPDDIPGIADKPDYLRYYPSKDSTKKKQTRGVVFYGPYWSDNGTHGVVDIYSQDNKDRWLMLLDASTGKLKLLDRQRDEAWIDGPGIRNDLGWIDESTFWFQSEISGYSHLFTVNVVNDEKKQLTKGNYEVQEAHLSKNKKYFYIITNEFNPGEQQFYRLSIAGNNAERITQMTGANSVTISPDEKQIAILYSYSNKPWELYLQENKPGATAKQITFLGRSAEFSSYPWRDPEIVNFTARDGAKVYARLYRAGKDDPAKPAVIFVHGAGYLQNAHKWWSYYFREFMFNNLLADNGFTVLDIDYRGSAGYGRDWRTAIYRHMGGKDLDDQIDGSKYLIEKFGVNPQHIGIYGGSYGGFITLMAMFTTPDVFAAGAGLRSVTDWAHYNHGYTANILNEPFNDSIAYKQSSPIYFAAGLKGHLLMCHGIVDQNVHFQDIVRLTQRLIELGKNNWELAVYPVEDHGFVEPSSWTDEYKRIFKLFQTYLK
jgi:dipeptidyl aminopeptidase/acylaminoacyl peptidase